MVTIKSGLEKLRETRQSPFAPLRQALGGRGVQLNVNWGSGDPDFDTPEHIRKALGRALDAGQTHYVSSSGIPELREAISDYYKKNFNVDSTMNNVLVTHGSTNGLFYAITNLLKPGDEVAAITPVWFGYWSKLDYAGAKVVEIPLSPPKWRLERDTLEDHITPNTKMLLFATPNNPAGNILSREDLKAIADVSIEKDLWVVSDEIYCKLVYDGAEFTSFGEFPEISNRAIIVNGFSKTYNMTGIRLGWLIADEGLIGHLSRVASMTNTCISPAIQQAGVAALTGPQDFVPKQVEDYDRRRKDLVNGLNQIEGITCPMPEGAFYAFPDIQEITSSSWDFAFYLAREHKILTVPGESCGQRGEGYLRLSFSTADARPENSQKSLEHLNEAARNYIKNHVK